MEDELAREPGPVGGLHSGNTSLVPSHNLSPGPELILALNPAPVPAPTPAPVASEKLFKKFMKAYLETNQGPRQPPEERKQTLKAKVPEVYYGKSYIDCYHFCQQCEDYFETAETTGFNWTPFAASFPRGNISMRWAQFKHCNKGEELTSIT